MRITPDLVPATATNLERALSYDARDIIVVSESAVVLISIGDGVDCAEQR